MDDLVADVVANDFAYGDKLCIGDLVRLGG